MKLSLKLKSLMFLAILLPALHAAFAMSSFTLQAIQITGLQRISEQTVLNALPVSVGETFTAQDSQRVINALYETQFFKDIELMREGDALNIAVVERPTIDTILITGNKAIVTDQLKEALNNTGIREGHLYDDALLDSMKKSLEREYHARGQYMASVTTHVIPKSRNRVDIKFDIDEGKPAKIRAIKFIGNETYSARTLRRQMQSRTPGLFTFFTQSDRYQRDKLQADLQALTDFYLDNGFINFKIVNSQVSLTPDKRGAYITITIEEGPRFRLSDWSVAGEMLGLRVDVEAIINEQLTPGGYYSRKDVVRTQDRLSTLYGDKGYAFFKAEVIPTVDEESETISLRLYIKTGEQVYVRRINFEGNHKTQNIVLRRELRQMEGALFNLSHLRESERQLRLLSYFKNVGTRTQSVAGDPDLLDLTFVVNESIKTGAISAGAGYNSAESWFVNFMFKQPNFMGTGKTIGFSATRSTHQYLVSLNYDNPYFTQNGVSSGFSVYVQQVDPVNVTDYVMSVYGASYNLGMRLTDNDRVSVGIGLEHVDLHTGSEPSAQVNYFITTQGETFDDNFITWNWVHNGYDRGIFPTKGYYQSLGGVVSLQTFNHDLPYYKLHYFGHLFVPLYSNFILSLRGEVGYGNGYDDLDQLPFFKNFYAGGMDTVRGYRTNTLGPRAYTPIYGVPGVVDSKDNLRAIGGNLLMAGSIEVILPQFKDSLRISTYLDFGNVFNTDADDFNVCVDGNGLLNLCKKPTCTGATNPCPNLDGAPSLSEIRTSIGVAFEWYSPMGPLTFTIARALNAREFDETKRWDFKVGANI